MVKSTLREHKLVRSRVQIPPGSVVRPYSSVTLLIVIEKMDDLSKTSFTRAELQFFVASVDLIEKARTDGRCLKRRFSFEELQQEAIKIKEDHPLKQKQKNNLSTPRNIFGQDYDSFNEEKQLLWWEAVVVA